MSYSTPAGGTISSLQDQTTALETQGFRVRSARLKSLFFAWLILSVVALAAVIGYIALPATVSLPLAAPLQPLSNTDMPGSYTADLEPLRSAFQPQRFRSFCGPASLATGLRAYGQTVTQTQLIPSFTQTVEVFFTGMSLADLDGLAQNAGLRTTRVYADQLTLEQFREQLKINLATAGDFVIVNYDRKTLQQEGSGHISTIGAYDAARDRFLVLDAAAYRYPFTWVPAPLLYRAVHSKVSNTWRGVLFIHGVGK